MSSFTSEEEIVEGAGDNSAITPSRKTVIKTYQKTLKRELMNSFFETQKNTDASLSPYKNRLKEQQASSPSVGYQS